MVFLNILILLQVRNWLFIAKWTIMQLYHGENKLILFRWDDDDVFFVSDQHA